MEHNISEQDENKMIIDQEALNFLKSVANWAKFFAIVGFITMGLLIIFGFMMGGIMKTMGKTSELDFPPIIFGILYLIVGGIYFYPTLALFKFAKYSKFAVKNLKTDALTESFKQLKNTFQYIGILLIIGLAIYGFAILIMIVAAFFL